MSNGTMKIVNGVLQGEVRTMRLNFRFQLIPLASTERGSDKAPTHRIDARSPLGHICQVGVAWERVINKGRTSGLNMYTLQLDDPEFGPETIYLNAFPGYHEDWQLTLERKRADGNTVSPVGDAEAAAAA